MIELIMACAPGVAPYTIQEIVRVESEGNPITINVNKRKGVSFPHKKIEKKRDAIAVTLEAMRLGHSVDIGYMQLNSSNLEYLGYTVADAFQPCKNLAGGAKIFSEAYATCLKKGLPEQPALLCALSIYNTGNSRDGFHNGYVQRYMDSKPRRPTINPYTATTAVSFTKKEKHHE